MKPHYTRFEFKQLSLYVAGLNALTIASDYLNFLNGPEGY